MPYGSIVAFTVLLVAASAFGRRVPVPGKDYVELNPPQSTGKAAIASTATDTRSGSPTGWASTEST